MALKTKRFDASEYIDDDESVAAYLSSILEENNPGLLAAALGDVARARGMSEIAREGLNKSTDRATNALSDQGDRERWLR
jgi:probable addiction module antidote protein